MSWELGQEAHVVLEKDLDVVEAVLELGRAVEADAESEAADFLGVVIHKAVDGGIDHAGAEKFDPSSAFAFRTSSSACWCAGSDAERAGNVELDGRLGERKITGAEARLDAGVEELFDEIFDGAGEIAEGDVGVNGQALDLVKGEGVRGVGIVAAVDLAGNDDADRGLVLFHGANLHGRSVGAKEKRRLRSLRQIPIERVHVVSDVMKFGDIQGFEIIVRRFDFGALDNGEADGEEDVFDFLEDLAEHVMRADGANDAGEGGVDALARRCDRFGSRFSRHPKYLR